MTQQHTPGPWRVRTGMSRPEGPAVFAPITMVAGDTMLVKVADCDISSSLPSDQREANARLIAAAPELLAVCQTIAGWPHKDGETIIVDQARAASAKASPSRSAG